jgi:hypothetical protein
MRGGCIAAKTANTLLCARRCLATALQTNEHDDVCAPFFGHERFHTRIKHGAELIKDRFLDDPALVDAAPQLLQVYLGLDVLFQLAHNFDVHVALQQRGAYFLDQRLQTLCIAF